MARPINANAQETRLAILRSASKLFAEQGLEGSSVREISRAAGVSAAMINHCFGGKQALYEACIDAMYASLEALWRELSAQGQASAGDGVTLETIVTAAFRFACVHREDLRLLMRTVIDQGGLDEVRQARYQIPFLEQGAALWGHADESQLAARRLALQSVVHLVVRYALSAPSELALVLGQGAAKPNAQTPSQQLVREQLSQVEAHLVDVARLLLAPIPLTSTRELP